MLASKERERRYLVFDVALKRDRESELDEGRRLPRRRVAPVPAAAGPVG